MKHRPRNRRRRIPAWQKHTSDHVYIKREWSARLLLGRHGAPQSRAEKKLPFHNVVGIGLGEKRTAGRGTRQLCMRFLVKKKYAASSLPRKAQLPGAIDGIPTDVVEVGTLKAFTAPIPHAPHGSIAPGCSIGYQQAGYTANAGTVGAIVRDGTGEFFLSCNHVFLHDENQFPLPEIVHPGPLDDSSPQAVATLERRVPLLAGAFNRVDCAIARINASATWTVANSLYDSVAPPNLPQPGQRVKMIARSGIKYGVVSPGLHDVDLEHERGMVTMDDQIEVTGLAGAFGEEGDSGALVVDDFTNAALGLVCGGSDAATYVCPIGEVLTLLQVELM